MPKKKKIEYLESLRGIAAIMVACFHFKIFHYFGFLTQNSWMFVEFFFVLSGFVISLNYQYRISNIKDLITFQKRRFLRLYPLHFLTLGLMIFLLFAEFIKEYLIGNTGEVSALERYTLNEILANLLLLHNIVLDKVTFNQPSWSISSEFYVYLLFAILILILNKDKKKIIFISIIISTISFYYLLNNSLIPDTHGFTRCTYSFFLGVLIFNIYDMNKLKFPSFITKILILIIIIIMMNFKTVSAEIDFNIFMPLIFSLLILSLVSSKEDIIKKILINKNIVLLGTFSYGIYMLHMPVDTYTNIFLDKINLYDQLKFYFQFEEGVYNEIKGIACLIITVVLAKYSFIYFEKKFYK